MKNLQVLLLLLVGMFVPFVTRAYSLPGQPTGYVSDYAGILSDQTINELESLLSSLDASSSTQVAVVNIKSLDGDTIENFATKLFEDWQIGQKGKDNGALLLVAVEDRKVRIEVGYGLEGALTDAQSSSIIRNVITPRFKQNDYDQGILEGTQAIVKAIEGEYVGDSSVASTGGADDSFGIVMGILSFVIPLFLWLVSILARTKSWWLGGVIGAIVGGLFMSTAGLIVFGLIGLFLDYVVSSEYKKSTVTNSYPWWIGGKSGFGGGSSSRGGGFGGFGGGRSGGGGSSGSW